MTFNEYILQERALSDEFQNPYFHFFNFPSLVEVNPGFPFVGRCRPQESQPFPLECCTSASVSILLWCTLSVSLYFLMHIVHLLLGIHYLTILGQIFHFVLRIRIKEEIM